MARWDDKFDTKVRMSWTMQAHARSNLYAVLTFIWNNSLHYFFLICIHTSPIKIANRNNTFIHFSSNFGYHSWGKREATDKDGHASQNAWLVVRCWFSATQKHANWVMSIEQFTVWDDCWLWNLILTMFMFGHCTYLRGNQCHWLKWGFLNGKSYYAVGVTKYQSTTSMVSNFRVYHSIC
jgi:hypothetical protein